MYPKRQRPMAESVKYKSLELFTIFVLQVYLPIQQNVRVW